MQQFMQTAYNDWSRDKQLELELATATASILPENTDGEMHVTISGFSAKEALVDQYVCLFSEKRNVEPSKWHEETPKHRSRIC